MMTTKHPLSHIIVHGATITLVGLASLFIRTALSCTSRALVLCDHLTVTFPKTAIYKRMSFHLLHTVQGHIVELTSCSLAAVHWRYQDAGL